jgi:hypothetical protein
MNPGELAELVPFLIAEKLEDATAPVAVSPGPMHERFPSWYFRIGQALTLAAIFPERNELRMTVGLAHDVPYTPEVGLYVNNLNHKQLVFGRAFAVHLNKPEHAAILMQEIIFGDGLSRDYPPSVQNLLRIIGTLSGQAARLAAELLSSYGGRPLTDDEAFLFLQGVG